MFCNVVEAEGRGIEGTIERVIENIYRLGFHQVIVNSGQEPAVVDLVCGIIAARDGADDSGTFTSRRISEQLHR